FRAHILTPRERERNELSSEVQEHTAAPRPLGSRSNLSVRIRGAGLREMMARGERRTPKSQIRTGTIVSCWDLGFGSSYLTGELLDVDRLAAVARDKRSQRLLVNLLQDVANHAIGQEYVEAAADHAAQRRQRLALRECQLLRPRPLRRGARLDHDSGVGGPIDEARQPHALLALERRPPAVADAIECLTLLRRAVREGEDLRHAGNQSLVVRTVPGLVEFELVIQLLLAEVGQQGDAPAQERLAVLAVEGGRGQGAAVLVVLADGE